MAADLWSQLCSLPLIAQERGRFLKDQTADDVVIVKPAIAAGWQMLHGWMAMNSEQACYDEIENYVDGCDKGFTRKCMILCRFAEPCSTE